MRTEDLEILYVDDDRSIREIVALALGLDPGIRLRACASGHEALEMLRHDDWRPHLILLDVMMPNMDGRKLMELLKSMPDLDAVPVVFITARARSLDVSEYIALGAADVILKPFDPFELAGRLRANARPFASADPER